LLPPSFDEPGGDLVAARDSPEDVDQDGADLRVRQDQLHSPADGLATRPASHVEEVGRLAAVVLHQVHRGHRQPGPVDHAADCAVQVDEVDAQLSSLGVGGVFFVQVAQGFEARMSGEARVVERHLCVQADQTLGYGAARRRLGDDRQRIHLDQIRVVGLHRCVEPPRDRHERAQQRIAQADCQAERPGLEHEEPELRVGRNAVDGARVPVGHLFDLDSAFRRGH